MMNRYTEHTLQKDRIVLKSDTNFQAWNFKYDYSNFSRTLVISVIRKLILTQDIFVWFLSIPLRPHDYDF